MPVNLLAVCRTDNGLTVKRVKVTAEVQAHLVGIFIQQEQTFLEVINEEVVFDCGWYPDPNEFLFTPVTVLSSSVFAAAPCFRISSLLFSFLFFSSLFPSFLFY